jgi:AcrR family transcriptional regulator
MSSPARPPEVPSSAKRELLLETAWTLFCQNGYRAVGIDTVLAKAGVAKMTLYNHFDSKEDLIAAAMAKKGGELLVSIDEVIASAGKSPERRLLAVFDWLAGWFDSKHFTGCAFIKAVGEYTAAGDKPRQAAAAYKQALQDRLQTLAAEAGLKSPALLARQLMFLIDGATVHADMQASPAFAAEARSAAKALIEAARP